MKPRNFFSVPVTLAVIAAFCIGAYSSAWAENPVYGGTLTVGWIPQSKTFDPHKSVQWPERYILYCVFENLVKTDPSFSIVPGLAESWSNPDEKTYVFNLRKGVKFQDGTDFNAAAVKWNIERVLNPDFASPQRKLLEPYIASVEAKDDYTVVFHLKVPYAPLLSALAERPGFMVSPTAVQKMGDKKFALNPVGTGPFKLESWMPSAQLTLVKNKDYWDKGKPYLDRIVFKETPDPVVRRTLLEAGTVDIITDIVAKQAAELKKEDQIKLVRSQPARWRAMEWKVDREPFNNRALREAVAYGVDREEINEKLYYGQAEPAQGPVPPGVWWYEEGFKGYTYKPELAKKKLVEAGYPNGFSYRYTVENTQEQIQVAELLQAQLAKIGIKMEFEMVSEAEAYSRELSGQTNWTQTRWTQRADPHGLLSILFDSKGHANKLTHYHNPRVDELLAEGATTYDIDKRKKIYFEAIRLITMDAPYVFLVYLPEWAAMSNQVHGFQWIPDLIPRFAFLWKED